MTEERLEEMLTEKEIPAIAMIKRLNNRPYPQVAKAKHVSYDERDAKQLIEEVKAIEYILGDEEALEKVTSGQDDWREYVSSFTFS